MIARNDSLLFCAAAALALCAAAMPLSSARAQDDGQTAATDLFPPQPALGLAATAPVNALPTYDIAPDEDTHPMIRLTPEKAELVRLDSEARSIIVGNEATLSVLLDNAKTLVLVPHIPGATQFTVLDRSGKVIMRRHVIVASPKNEYLRVRNCGGTTASCENTTVYYCPDMCHEVAINTNIGTGMSGVAALPTGTGSEGGIDVSNSDDSGGESAPVVPSFDMDELMQNLQDQFQQQIENTVGGGNDE